MVKQLPPKPKKGYKLAYHHMARDGRMTIWLKTDSPKKLPTES